MTATRKDAAATVAQMMATEALMPATHLFMALTAILPLRNAAITTVAKTMMSPTIEVRHRATKKDRNDDIGLLSDALRRPTFRSLTISMWLIDLLPRGGAGGMM